MQVAAVAPLPTRVPRWFPRVYDIILRSAGLLSLDSLEPLAGMGFASMMLYFLINKDKRAVRHNAFWRVSRPGVKGMPNAPRVLGV